MADMIGVDIGATAVRVVSVAGVDSRGMAIVTKLGISSIKEGAIIGGRIRSPEEVSVALVRAFKEAGIRRYGFVIGMESPDIALSTIALPASLKKLERSDAIRTMNRPISPTFSIADSALSTCLLEASEINRVTMNTVSVAAALQSDVDMLSTICSLAKATPRAIDLTGAALLRAYTRANPENLEISTVVSIGASRTTVATRAGMHLRSLRTIAGAGFEVTRSIMQVTGEDFEKAEELKTVSRLNNAAATKTRSSYQLDESFEADGLEPIERSLNNATDLLVDSIAQAIDSDASNFGSVSQGVILCGGTALLRGLKEKLTQRIGIPVSIGRPWAELERSRRNALFFRDGKVDPRLMLAIGPAVGLALWKDPQ